MALGAVAAVLLLIGGFEAIQTVMVTGALPFSLVMVLMAISLIKAIYLDEKRGAAGISTNAPMTAAPDGTPAGLPAE